jgi:CheY-like chemotaxis protein
MTSEPTQPAAEKPGKSNRPSYQVLLVSDDPIVIDAIAAALRAEGHVPTIVSSGEEALHCIHSQPYDLIGAKFDLPRMNGEELACWVKALLPGQPFILAMNERDRSNRHQQSAADLVLRKPFTLQEAREAFYKLVEAKKPL